MNFKKTFSSKFRQSKIYSLFEEESKIGDLVLNALEFLITKFIEDSSNLVFIIHN